MYEAWVRMNHKTLRLPKKRNYQEQTTLLRSSTPRMDVTKVTLCLWARDTGTKCLFYIALRVVSITSHPSLRHDSGVLTPLRFLCLSSINDMYESVNGSKVKHPSSGLLSQTLALLFLSHGALEWLERGHDGTRVAHLSRFVSLPECRLHTVLCSLIAVIAEGVMRERKMCMNMNMREKIKA